MQGHYKIRITGLFAGLLLLLAACEKMMPPAPDDKDVLAVPLADMDGTQMALHVRGDEEFGRIFSSADGLGPMFVQNSCESCHVGDGKGNPLNNLTRIALPGLSGTWNPVLHLGGPQIQNRAIPGHLLVCPYNR